jgi:hypothetical protein
LNITYSSFSEKMSSQRYSREYLQSIPQQRKQEEIDRIVNNFKIQIFTAAAAGFTSYRYVRDDRANHHIAGGHPLVVLTDPEIIAGFFERFPGCKVYYEEAWVESGKDTKTLKKGIVIDWS